MHNWIVIDFSILFTHVGFVGFLGIEDLGDGVWWFWEVCLIGIRLLTIIRRDY